MTTEDRIINFANKLWVVCIVLSVISIIVAIVASGLRGCLIAILGVITILLFFELGLRLIEGFCDLIRTQKTTKNQMDKLVSILSDSKISVPADFNNKEVANGEWICSSCHTKNPKYRWTCNCSKPRTDITYDEYLALNSEEK